MVLAPAYRPHSQGTRVTALTPAMLARCVSARIGCPVLSVSSRAIVERTSYSGASLIVGLSGSCSTEKFLACASALPTAMLTVVRRSRLVTSRGSPKFRSRLARSRSAGPPCSSYFSPGGVAVAWQPSSWWTRTGMCPVGESCLSYRLTASTGSPVTSSSSASATASPQAAASLRHVASLAAIGCRPPGLSIHVEGGCPEGSCRVPSAVRPSSALRWKPARDGRKPRSGAAPRGATSSALITRRRSPGAIGEYPLPPFPPGRSPPGITMIARPSGSVFSKKSRPRMSQGPVGVPIGSPTERTGLPSPHRSIPSERHSSRVRNSGVVGSLACWLSAPEPAVRQGRDAAGGGGPLHRAGHRPRAAGRLRPGHGLVKAGQERKYKRQELANGAAAAEGSRQPGYREILE